MNSLKSTTYIRIHVLNASTYNLQSCVLNQTSTLHAEQTRHHHNGGYPPAQQSNRQKRIRDTDGTHIYNAKKAKQLDLLSTSGDGSVDCLVVDECS
jgi:hypothetical protein